MHLISSVTGEAVPMRQSNARNNQPKCNNPTEYLFFICSLVFRAMCAHYQGTYYPIPLHFPLEHFDNDNIHL